MAWKDVLVFADTSAHGSVRAACAAQLATAHGARLTVATFSHTRVPDAPHAPHGSAAHKAAEKEAAQLAAAAEAANAGLKGMVASLAPISDHTGIAQAAAELGSTSDVVITAYPKDEHEHNLGRTLFESTLLKSGRPVLVLPAWDAPQTVGKRVLIPWTTTKEASRAVHDALPLLLKADEVQLFVSGSGADFDHRGPYGLSRIEDHLTHHGVKLAPPCINDGHMDIGFLILDYAKDFNADLIVMGGYGHSPVQEAIVGGATKKMLDHAKTAVLFSH